MRHQAYALPIDAEWDSVDPLDWQTLPDLSDELGDDPTTEERALVRSMLGFDPVELWEDDEELIANEMSLIHQTGEYLRTHPDPAPMPGYGQIFIKDDGKGGLKCWYVGGDGDEDGFDEVVYEALLGHPVEGLEIVSVLYEQDNFPPRDEGWVQVYPTTRAWTANESYFGSCERDDKGRCLPSGEAEAKSQEQEPGKEREGQDPGKEPETRVSPGANSIKGIRAEQRTDCPDPCHQGNPEVDADKDGVTDMARVGVPADSVPPPPKIPRMPNLTKDERQVEEHYASAYEKDPDGMAAKFREITLKSAEKKAAKDGSPAVPEFSTDDAKALSPVWQAEGQDREVRALNRAIYNTCLHQTANAMAKRALLQHLDTLKEGDEILVTVGGCGAGKGFALKNVPEVKAVRDRCKAVWDSAGDQNATENSWVLKEAEKRGLKVNYVYVHADPFTQWAHPQKGVISRAKNPDDGRMVDLEVYTDSYFFGARNHQAFVNNHKDNPNARFIYMDNTGMPKRVDGMPEAATRVNRNQLRRIARKVIERQTDLPARIRRGALAGTARIWFQEVAL